jgi:hypothetical protein
MCRRLHRRFDPEAGFHSQDRQRQPVEQQGRLSMTARDPAQSCQPITGHSELPWRVFTNPDGTKLVGIGSQEGEGILDCGFGVWAWNDPQGIANANLVVEAVNSHAALKARITELEEALQPFAEIAKELTDALKDGDTNTMHWAVPTVGNLRAALRVLQPKAGT